MLSTQTRWVGHRYGRKCRTSPDASGRYAALLGARSLKGIPVDVFSTGEARWLGIQPDGQAEQPRVLLVSVPYALKASDAETLGGLPASAFLRSDSASTVQSAAQPAAYFEALNQDFTLPAVGRWRTRPQSLRR